MEQFPIAASAEEILGIDDALVEDVPVPEWRRTVRVKRLSGGERDAFEDQLFATQGDDRRFNRQNLRARLCAMAIVGPDGRHLFTPEQVARLGEKCAPALDRLYDVAQRLSGLRKQDVDELEKKLEPAPGSPSSSGSPPTSTAESGNSSPASTAAN